MSASSEASAFRPSDSSTVQPSFDDPRFVVDKALQLTQEGEARGYGFSYFDGQLKRQVTEWVFSAKYTPPPALEAIVETPSDPARRFNSRDEWQQALEQNGPDAIWQKDSTFASSWVATFDGVPSPDPSFYAPYEAWPKLPAATEGFGQIDPGEAHAPAQILEVPSLIGAVNTQAAIRVVTASVAGHPEVGDTKSHTAEFWAMFSSYQQPTNLELPVVPGPPSGVPSQTLVEFLDFWHVGSGPLKVQSLAVVTCSRSDENPYQA